MTRKWWFLVSVVLVAGVFAIVRAQEPTNEYDDRDEPRTLSLEDTDDDATRSVLKKPTQRLSPGNTVNGRRSASRVSDETLVPESTSTPDLEAPSVLKRKTKPAATKNSATDTVRPAERTAQNTRGSTVNATSGQAQRTGREPQPESVPASAGSLNLTSAAPRVSIALLGPSAVIAGKAGDYVVVLENAGDESVRDLHVRLTIPQGVDVLQSEINHGSTRRQEESGLDRLVWAVDEIPGNSRMELNLQLVARQGRPIDLNIEWIFRAISTTAQIEVQQPQLELTMAGPKDVLYGETITYLVTLANPGNGDAENVVLKLGAGNNAMETINVDTIPAGQQKEIEVQLTASQSGAMKIRALASAAGDLSAELSEEIIVRRAELEVGIQGPKVKYAATESTYEIEFTNSGNAIAEEVQATLLLPPGAKLVSASDGGKQSGSGVQWRIGNVGPGAQRVLQLVCELTASGDNRVEIRLAGAGGLTSSDSVITQVQSLADLKLTVNEPKGPRSLTDSLVYEIQIVNRGTKSAEKVNVIVQFSDGIEPAAAEGGKAEILTGQVVFATLNKIDAGQQVVLKVRAKGEREGSHLFRVEVKCDEPETRLVSEGTTRFYGDEGEPSGSSKIGRKPDPNRKSRQPIASR
ncbi:MAG: DUF11 domain-containing protein [Planctomycetes bacterium]|nr:DUF11 domain-containing protein [Planctomycetota bacterium]